MRETDSSSPLAHGKSARKVFIPGTTKYVYVKCTTVYVPSSELGLPHPFPASECALSPRNQGGGGTLAYGQGGGGVPIPTTGEKA